MKKVILIGVISALSSIFIGMEKEKSPRSLSFSEHLDIVGEALIPEPHQQSMISHCKVPELLQKGKKFYEEANTIVLNHERSGNDIKIILDEKFERVYTLYFNA